MFLWVDDNIGVLFIAERWLSGAFREVVRFTSELFRAIAFVASRARTISLEGSRSG